MQAQLFSTAGRATSFPSQSHYDYPSSSFRSTSSYPTSYDIPTNAFPTSHKVGNGRIHRAAGRIQSAQGRIHTAAARLGNGIVSDQIGYIATQPILYNSGDDVFYDDYTTYDDDGTYDNDDDTQAPPQFAPLDFDWQVALFMLLLCLGYGIYIRKKSIQPAK